MKYGVYLKERWGWAAIFLWLLFSMETFLLTVSGGSWLGIYAAVCLTAGYFAGTYMDFRRQKKYYEELRDMAESMDKKYLLSEMAPAGKRQEEKILDRTLYLMGKSMNEYAEGYRRRAKEYKEYIELWIHEVKVPIAAVKMMIENHPSGIETELTAEVERIEGYTEQALFYARSSAVEKDYLIRKVTLRSLVEETVLQKKKPLLAAKAKLSFGSLEQTVYSDSKWLVFILGQIVDNSIKYAGDGPPDLEIWAEEQKGSARLILRDKGIGIPGGETDRVCEKGFTGSNGRKYARSTGLGLYLCDKLCRRLGHRIEVQSREGEGCMVTLIFPKSDFMDIT